MCTTRIADSYVGADSLRNPLGARHKRQHQLDAAQMRNDLRVPRRIWIGNPHIEFNIVVKIPRQSNQLDFRREIGEQFGS